MTKNRIFLTLIILLCVSLCSPSILANSAPLDDIDPLVDIEVTVSFQKIRAFDKLDLQLLVNEYIDKNSDPDFYIKVFINGEEFVSPVWSETKYIYEPNWSATLNVPDDERYVDITIQLWDSYDEGAIEEDMLCDISGDPETYDVDLEYDLYTGHWTGDDSLGDPSGYGRLSGCDDGSIYAHDRDCELWFDISFNDYDADSIPYWMETITYGTDPMVNDTGADDDVDGVPIEWEWKWGFNPLQKENHEELDPEEDGLHNIEEYMTSQWCSDPYRKDLFMEMDLMEQADFPEGAKELLYTVYDRQNVVYHLDDGDWEGTGTDIIPYDESTSPLERNEIYEEYFLHGDPNNSRLGIFHYGVVVYQDEEVNGCAFGSNRFQVSSHGMEEKAEFPLLDRDVVYASAYMHETGHTLGFMPIPGHNRFSKYFYQLGWWLNRPYISCMNYGYMYKMVDYSNGERLFRDYDDWERMDLTYFQRSWGW